MDNFSFIPNSVNAVSTVAPETKYFQEVISLNHIIIFNMSNNRSADKALSYNLYQLQQNKDAHFLIP